MQILDFGELHLVDMMGDEARIVEAARVSFRKKGKRTDAQLLRYLIRNKHTSPFEHVQFTFMVKCPIFVARQWMRHRTGKYNEISGRYSELPSEFYMPEVLCRQDEKNKQASGADHPESPALLAVMKNFCAAAFYAYEHLLTEGVSREQARMVLPLNTYTSFYFTMDLHNLMHFCNLRNHEHAQPEIRVYAAAIEGVIQEKFPTVYSAWREEKECQTKMVTTSSESSNDSSSSSKKLSKDTKTK